MRVLLKAAHQQTIDRLDTGIEDEISVSDGILVDTVAAVRFESAFWARYDDEISAKTKTYDLSEMDCGPAVLHRRKPVSRWDQAAGLGRRNGGFSNGS